MKGWLICWVFVPLVAIGQQPVSWEVLQEVEITYLQDSIHNTWELTPSYSDEILSLEGVDVSISGFVIPVSLESNEFVLSAFPFASCFFCGGAGPESVIAILPRKKVRLSTDEIRTFSGRFSIIHHSDGLLYQLENATLHP